MDIVTTIISAVILILILVYIIKEIKRRKRQNNAVEINYDLKISFIFYLVSVSLFVCFHVWYYLSVYPSARQIEMFIVLNIVFLIFSFISYVLARKRLIATQDKLELNRLFYKKVIDIKEITKIKRTTLTIKIYAGDKKLIAVDVRYYNNIRKFLSFVKEQSNCIIE